MQERGRVSSLQGPCHWMAVTATAHSAVVIKYNNPEKENQSIEAGKDQNEM